MNSQEKAQKKRGLRDGSLTMNQLWKGGESGEQMTWKVVIKLACCIRKLGLVGLGQPRSQAEEFELYPTDLQGRN